MRVLKPVSFTAEQMAEAQKQLGVQEAQQSMPKSRDPINYPVFDVPINKKVLVYVPNHTVLNDEGVSVLRMDRPLLHDVKSGGSFMKYRCTYGLKIPGTSFDGTCPMCAASQEPFTLANLVIKEKCGAQGLDPEDKENEIVKAIRSGAFSDRDLKSAERSYTFPVVRFETVNDDAKTFVSDDKGNTKFYIEWYTISERQWGKTWAKALEGMEDEPTHPGGRFFCLNYCYDSKGKAHNKRDSAQNLNVSPRRFQNTEDFCLNLDKLTESWTPELAQQMVIQNGLCAVEDLTEVTDEILVKTRSMIELYEAKSNGLPTSDGFEMKKIEGGTSGGAATPQSVGETDIDEE